MAVRIEEFVAHLGWEVDPGKLQEFNTQVRGLTDMFKKVAIAVAGATTALTAFAVITNKQTSINTRLAESQDINAASLENWTFLLGAIDFNAEKVVRTMKDLNVRVGQAAAGFGDATTIKDAVRALGLSFEDLKRQAPEEQFKTILQAAKDLDNGQAALAVSQQLLGRQGTFLTGFLRDQQGTIEELLTDQAKYNLLTDEGRERAKAFVGLWDNFNAVIDSGKAAFASFLGEALSPLLAEFLKFVRENRELIKLRIAEWAERVARFMTSVFRVLRVIVSIIDRIVTAFGGLENVLALLAGLGTGIFLFKLVKTFQALLPLILTATARTAAFKAVMTTGKAAGFIGLLVLAGLAINSLVRFLQGKDSLVGDIGDSIAESAHRGVQALADFFGFSKEEFDVWLVGVVDGIADAFTAVWDTVVSIFEGLRNLTWADISDAFAQTFERMKAVITGFFEELMIIDWSTIGDIWKGIFFDVVEKIKGWINSLISTITSVPDKVNSIISSIKSLPFFGGEETPRRRATPTTTSRTAAAIPSTIATQAAAQTRSIQNITNQQRSARQVSQRNTFNISQRPGEDAQGFARRVAAVLETEAATAVRDNATGIVK